MECGACGGVDRHYSIMVMNDKVAALKRMYVVVVEKKEVCSTCDNCHSLVQGL